MTTLHRATAADVRKARELADFYRARGFNPLPSRLDEKRPWLRSYREYMTSPLPAEEFNRVWTTNVQVVCGVAWGLLVIDLDGEESAERWREWTCLNKQTRTWTVVNGGPGRHLWFSLPRGCSPIPKAVLWQGEGKHSAIERLCDGSLIMAPPSIHPKTGERYRFLDRAHSPLSLPKPAQCPEWVLRLRPLAHSGLVAPSVTYDQPRLARGRPCTPRPRASAPLSTTDPIELARSWGIRFTGRIRKGWAECHAFDREDTKPSAAIHTEHGGYCDLGTGTKLSLAQLGVALNQFRDVKEALRELRRE